MPRIRLTLPGNPVPWTKVQNSVIDGLMPQLRDTEFRIVMVLVRGTTGWNRHGQQVPMTYRTLMLRTGRGSEAVAKALASLRDKGLIHTPGPMPLRIPVPPASETRRTTNRNK